MIFPRVHHSFDCLHHRDSGEEFIIDNESRTCLRNVAFSGICQRELMNKNTAMTGTATKQKTCN